MKTTRLNELIPVAMAAIKDSEMNKFTRKKKDEPEEIVYAVPSALKGYIPAMGASILQAGLLPTVAFYMNNSGKDADSRKLLNAIQRIITDKYEDMPFINYILKRCQKDENTTGNWGRADLDPQELTKVTREILTALTALKLAVRTFKIDE